MSDCIVYGPWYFVEKEMFGITTKFRVRDATYVKNNGEQITYTESKRVGRWD